MSRQQYVFIIGVILVWVGWDAGWVVFAAVAAGLIGIAVVRTLEGAVDISGITDHFRSPAERSSAGSVRSRG